MTLDEAIQFTLDKSLDGYVPPEPYSWWVAFAGKEVIEANALGHTLIQFLPETGITWQEAVQLKADYMRQLMANRWNARFVILYASAWMYAGLWLNSSNIENRNIILTELVDMKKLQVATYNRQAEIVDTLKEIRANQ